MNFSKQLKKYREVAGLSQEALAEKIYVTRQTISKWENDHTYPDIHNLIILSTLFDVTLDELIKGDIPMMKRSLESEKMNKLNWVMLGFIALAALIMGPLVYMWSWYGLIIPFMFWIISMVAAMKIEKIKKEKDVQNYAEIVAFTEGRDLEAVRAQRDKKQDRWDKIKIVVSFSLIVFVIALITSFIWSWLV